MSIATKQHAPVRHAVEQFRAWIETRHEDERWELIDGVMVMVPPGNVVHKAIQANLSLKLENTLAKYFPKLRAYTETAVEIPGATNWHPIPDVLVGGKWVKRIGYLKRYLLTAEVLSDDSEESDKQKTEQYQKNPDLLYALIIDQSKVSVKIYSKAMNWNEVELKDLQDEIRFPEFNFVCVVRDLYDGTPLHPDAADFDTEYFD